MPKYINDGFIYAYYRFLTVHITDNLYFDCFLRSEVGQVLNGDWLNNIFSFFNFKTPLELRLALPADMAFT